MKKQLLLNLGLLLYSLLSFAQDDPFNKINFGIDKSEIIISNWEQEGILTDPEYENLLFKYLIKGKAGNFPVEVAFNPDGYQTDEIRQVKLMLNLDEIIVQNENKFIRRARMARSINEVEEILKIYYKYYGEPDSIIVPELSDLIKSLNKALGRSTESQERTYIWERKDHQIAFYIPEPSRININESELFYDSASITYSTLDYGKKLFEIQEKIRQGLAPADIIEIWLKNPNWIPSANPDAYKGVYDFHYDIDMARKIAPEEKRAIKAVKFDIVFIDSFKDEVARWKGINFLLPEPIEQNSYIYTNKGYSITYDSRDKKALPLEIGRQISESSGITIKADVIGILYTNGELLKN